MKKVERLQFIEKNFGKQFVLPYRVCSDAKEIKQVVKLFETQGVTWGMRTDQPNGSTQGYSLPFLHRGNLKEALDIFKNHGNDLIYIVSHNILHYHCNGVAIPTGEEEVFFEVNNADDVPQRDMYKNPENLRQFFIGPSRKVLYNGRFLPCFKPEDNYPNDLGIVEIYRLLFGRSGMDEVTFSVRDPGRKVVIW